MEINLTKGQLYDFLKHYEDKSEFDKLFEEQGLPIKEKRTLLHFYTLFFIIEIGDNLRFYSTTFHFLFSYSKSEIPKQLLDIFALYTTNFDQLFTINSRKANYTRAKKIWLDTEEDMPMASESDSISITYYNDFQTYTCDLLHIYRRQDDKVQKLDLRDIDEDILNEIFNMNVKYYPEHDFSKPSVFFDFYSKLLIQITREIPRKMRPVDIEINVARKND